MLTAGSWDVKVSLCLNNVAWNNRIRPRFYSVGLIEQQTSWLMWRLKVYFKCGSIGICILIDLLPSGKTLEPFMKYLIFNFTIKALFVKLALTPTEAMVKRNSRGGISTAS